MKLPLLFVATMLFLAVAPPVTSTPIFGVTTSSDPLQVAALAGGLLLAFKLGKKLGRNRSRNRNRSRGRSRYRNRNRNCHRCRGKRQDEQEEYFDDEQMEMLESLLVQIGEGGATSCFQRLVCDISADPQDFAEDLPILAAVQVEADDLTDPIAQSVLKSLQDAVTIGENGSVRTCEQTYNQCQLTGLEMKSQIHQEVIKANLTR